MRKKRKAGRDPGLPEGCYHNIPARTFVRGSAPAPIPGGHERKAVKKVIRKGRIVTIYARE